MSASPSTANQTKMVLSLSCTNARGIVHAVSGALLSVEGDITESKQFDSPESGNFFMRVEFVTPQPLERVREALEPVEEEFGMEIGLWEASRKTRALIMCSKDGRTLNDLLFQQRAGTLPIDIPVIVSNHLELQPMAYFYGIPFVHIPLIKRPDGTDNKAEAEARLMELVNEYDIELVVLARYMQVLSDDLCRKLGGRAINIHHSFLPSFKGAKPYHQAHERGVKLIGATAHYVTPDLDEGPIIDQTVQRVTHAQSARDFVNMGREVEGSTLCRAVRWHAEHRVLLDGNRTVVFD
ncbi:formyltetrahydrofolate deformylase [Citricoccus sp. SGAir0253]|uniref:formyltetrahydrofolate deformylase n=1 Tax=Citricoccus sp. SGAir0253 TaxID=2567881 RepID=UPI0010CD4DBF|nr:formyltetrahydrofolate deformylase [Citricoccus sp. SGAir0253]QCU78709.1 formyltetrahydrofolate deformylase [Citricoccus sp. SGAir0253]